MVGGPAPRILLREMADFARSNIPVREPEAAPQKTLPFTATHRLSPWYCCCGRVNAGAVALPARCPRFRTARGPALRCALDYAHRPLHKKAGPFSVARLKMDLPFRNRLAYNHVHKTCLSEIVSRTPAFTKGASVLHFHGLVASVWWLAAGLIRARDSASVWWLAAGLIRARDSAHQ